MEEATFNCWIEKEMRDGKTMYVGCYAEGEFIYKLEATSQKKRACRRLANEMMRNLIGQLAFEPVVDVGLPVDIPPETVAEARDKQV